MTDKLIFFSSFAEYQDEQLTGRTIHIGHSTPQFP